MALADLRRLVQRATPRVEDHRCPDRTDFIRREHGHLTFRETVDALDALEFSVDSFTERMREFVGEESTSGSADAESAVFTSLHGLLHVLQGVRVLEPAYPRPAGSGPEQPEFTCTPSGDGSDNWETVSSEARARGTEFFKQQAFADAAEQYAVAIRATPNDKEQDLRSLYSNRAAALLKLDKPVEALAEARQCVAVSPTWPKGRFREGCCLRQLQRLDEAVHAFSMGQGLEPSNNDWTKELERTDRERRAQPSAQIRQLVLNMLPELFHAWIRGAHDGDLDGVLQLQVNGELQVMGSPKWQLLREKHDPAKAQIRYAFVSRRAYLANLAANLQASPPTEGVAVTSLEGEKIKIAEVSSFLSQSDNSEGLAMVHLDVKVSGRMVAFLVAIPCDEIARRFTGTHKEPDPPKGSIEPVLQIQQKSGFAKVLPKLLGFQSFPGQLNFPVVDVARDAPQFEA